MHLFNLINQLITLFATIHKTIENCYYKFSFNVESFSSNVIPLKFDAFKKFHSIDVVGRK